MSSTVASPDRAEQPIETAEQRRARRHPAALTADRVSEHIAAYTNYLTPVEIGILSRAYSVLGEIPDRIKAAGGDPA